MSRWSQQGDTTSIASSIQLSLASLALILDVWFGWFGLKLLPHCPLQGQSEARSQRESSQQRGVCDRLSWELGARPQGWPQGFRTPSAGSAPSRAPDSFPPPTPPQTTARVGLEVVTRHGNGRCNQGQRGDAIQGQLRRAVEGVQTPELAGTRGGSRKRAGS